MDTTEEVGVSLSSVASPLSAADGSSFGRIVALLLLLDSF